MNRRFLPLDVLRGLTVALMIVVNNPGSWSRIFPPLRHAAWDGCTPTDLVFPFFLFCVGASMAFSLAKYDGLSGSVVRKVLKRGALIFLVGFGLNAFPFYPMYPDPSLSIGENWLAWLAGLRVFGVLQRIAVSYIIASVLALWLRTPGRIAGAIAALGGLHVALLLAFAGPEGAFTLEGCFARRLDVALVGESHVYHGYTFADGTRAAFDPEGLLGSLTGACTALLGFLAGRIARNGEAPYAVVARLAVFAAFCLLVSQILGIWIPINKPLWSVSYVFYTAGWAMLVLAVLTDLIEEKRIERPFVPFKAMGMNPLAIFVLSGILAKTISGIIGWNYPAVFGADEWMSLLYAVLFMFLHMAIAMILYKKKIIIKL